MCYAFSASIEKLSTLNLLSFGYFLAKSTTHNSVPERKYAKVFFSKIRKSIFGQLVIVAQLAEQLHREPEVPQFESNHQQN